MTLFFLILVCLQVKRLKGLWKWRAWLGPPTEFIGLNIGMGIKHLRLICWY